MIQVGKQEIVVCVSIQTLLELSHPENYKRNKVKRIKTK